MIFIDVSKNNWKEMEELHERYLIETIPENWYYFEKKRKIDASEKNNVKKILEKKKIKIPDKNDDKNKKKKDLKTLINLCTSLNCLKNADNYKKDNLFIGTGIKVEERSRYINYIIDILGYKKFNEGIERVKTKDGKNRWCRHTFMNRLGIKVCPYCNRQYITSYKVHRDTIKTTTDTDHYFPKSEFPLLSMNIYNMVPSCQICNSRMKINCVVDYGGRHLYPYEDLSDSLKFEIPFSKVEELYNFSENDIKICLKTKKGDEISKRAKQSKEIFKLEQVYEAHRDIVYKLKNNMKEYSTENYKKIFCKNYTDIFGGYDNFLEVLYPFLGEDEKEVPLVKLKKDIYEYIQNKSKA